MEDSVTQGGEISSTQTKLNICVLSFIDIIKMPYMTNSTILK